MKPRSELLSRPFASELVERFVRYVQIDSTSDRHVEDIPSTPNQWNIAKLLVKELEDLGVEDLVLDDHCYLIARLPPGPGLESRPSIGLMAHMDTASDVPGQDVKPRVVAAYDGGPLVLGSARRSAVSDAADRGSAASETLVLDPAENPDLAEHAGDTIVVTDGSTLLGADDKAGIAEIMTAARYILTHDDIPHGPIELIFTPDEETGKGMNLFPLQNLRSKICYTVDGGKAGEIEAECFNAYSVNAEFKGRSIHIGSARGKLANAVAMAGSFISMLPRSESPEATDGWYGYYCPLEMSGGIERAAVEVFLRDFTREGMDRRIETLGALAKAVEAQFPLGSVELTVAKQYLNMREKLDERPEVLERLMEAARRAGAEPFVMPIRGGTDGARLTEMGVPTPNMFTGGYNYHSRYEWASLSDMALATDTLLELVNLWAHA
ncbi:MAG: peptidase T [Rectinemataceae bacterium]